MNILSSRRLLLNNGSARKCRSPSEIFQVSGSRPPLARHSVTTSVRYDGTVINAGHEDDEGGCVPQALPYELVSSKFTWYPYLFISIDLNPCFCRSYRNVLYVPYCTSETSVRTGNVRSVLFWVSPVRREDNQGCIALATDALTTNMTKHIDVRYHFIRQCVQRNHVKVIWIPTLDMVADILTKLSCYYASQHYALVVKMLGGRYKGPSSQPSSGEC